MQDNAKLRGVFGLVKVSIPLILLISCTHVGAPIPYRSKNFCWAILDVKDRVRECLFAATHDDGIWFNNYLV